MKKQLKLILIRSVVILGSCLALAQVAQAGTLYIALDTQGKIASANGDGTGLNLSFLSPPVHDRLLGVAVDAAHGKIYWSDYEGQVPGAGRIGVANLDGTDMNANLITGLTGPIGLTVDPVNGQVYWAEDAGARVARANIDGTGVMTLVLYPNAASCYDVAIDVPNNKLYYANVSSPVGGGYIGRANLDGTGDDRTLINTASIIAFGVDLDLIHGKVYYANFDGHAVGQANLDGTGNNPNFILGTSQTVGVAVDPIGGHIYWSRYQTGSIGQSDLNGGGVNQSFITGVGPLWKLTFVNPCEQPVATITGPASGSVYAVGTPVTFTGTFTGASGPHTAQWTIGGTVVPGVVDETAQTVTATVTFSSDGVYPVQLTVANACGNSATTSTVGGLSAQVVIYDPSAGLVIGGGWINSPAGAYVADPTLTGKAIFGFVSIYLKGATVPTGDTEFQLNAGKLNFQSRRYEWLVISGARAQYKGAGTLNGVPGYGFLLTAIDGRINGGGGTDTFRIKIWNATGVVYDNQMGADDSATPTTKLGGGSIVILK
jgi:hypothetical protein